MKSARATDPITSHEAAGSVDKHTQKLKVIAALRAVGRPVTPYELNQISKIPLQTINRRCSELEIGGKIRRGKAVKRLNKRAARLIHLIELELPGVNKSCTTTLST